MSACEQELCSYWTGDGCICKVLDIDRPQANDLGDLFVGILETTFDFIASLPAFILLDRIISGPVTPPE